MEYIRWAEWYSPDDKIIHSTYGLSSKILNKEERD